jgi:hypothetical protein
MQIDGLNFRQFQLLEELWSVEGSEDLFEWFENLSTLDKKTVISLMEVIRHEMLEPYVEENMEQANLAISKAKTLDI